MRGKVAHAPAHVVVGGITPAYAGKSLAEFGKTSKAWDHPRLCGEKEKIPFCNRTTIGSPPPMRGKVSEFRIRRYISRITPAYAGKSTAVA